MGDTIKKTWKGCNNIQLMKNLNIRPANVDDLKCLEPIFSLYRSFYGMERDSQSVMNFLKERIENNQSVLLVAIKNENIIGFAQLFPTFSSTSLKKVYILNDLYVLESDRKQGIARLLISRAIEIAKNENCARVSLSTAKDNPAQILYEKAGFKESTFKFYNYIL